MKTFPSSTKYCNFQDAHISTLHAVRGQVSISAMMDDRACRKMIGRCSGGRVREGRVSNGFIFSGSFRFNLAVTALYSPVPGAMYMTQNIQALEMHLQYRFGFGGSIFRVPAGKYFGIVLEYTACATSQSHEDNFWALIAYYTV